MSSIIYSSSDDATEVFELFVEGKCVYTYTPTPIVVPKVPKPVHPRYWDLSTAERLSATISPVLYDTPMGWLPETLWQSNGYALFPSAKFSGNYTHYNLVEHIGGWYLLQYLLAQPDLYPLYSHRRDYLERRAAEVFHGIADFMSDYFLAACVAESRHFSNAYANCGWCSQYTHHGTSSTSRWPHVTGTWGLFPNRGECLKWLLHVFLDHYWDSAGVGGPNWGYIASLVLQLNQGFYTGDTRMLTIAFNDIMYAHHCTSNVIQSRFTWSEPLIGYDLNNTLSANYTGKQCCWKSLALPAVYTSIAGDLLTDAPMCHSCETKLTETGPNAQKRFVTLHRQCRDERCTDCGGNARTNQFTMKKTCKRFCDKCSQCIPGDGNLRQDRTHMHSCPSCGNHFSNPENPICPNWCDLCDICRGHTKCHIAKQSFHNSHQHKMCKTCHNYGICLHLTVGLSDAEMYSPCLVCRPEFNVSEITPEVTEKLQSYIVSKRDFFINFPTEARERLYKVRCGVCFISKLPQFRATYYSSTKYICSTECASKASSYYLKSIVRLVKVPRVSHKKPAVAGKELQ